MAPSEGAIEAVLMVPTLNGFDGSLKSSTSTLPRLPFTTKSRLLAGSKAGKVIGEYGGKAYNTVSEFFGGNKDIKPKDQAAVVPVRNVDTGAMVRQVSTENKDLERLTSQQQSTSAPIVSTSVNNNNTTSFVPIKASPRPEFTGSALDRYQRGVTVY
jgi:hypothetical protein